MLYDERAVLGFREACVLKEFFHWSIHQVKRFRPLKFVCQFCNPLRCRDCSQHWQIYALSKTPDFQSCWDKWRHEIVVNGNCSCVNVIRVISHHWCWGMWMKIFECWQQKLTRQGEDTCFLAKYWRWKEHLGVIRTRHRLFHSMTLQLQFPLVYDAFPVSAWLLSGWVAESIAGLFLGVWWRTESWFTLEEFWKCSAEELGGQTEGNWD